MSVLPERNALAQTQSNVASKVPVSRTRTKKDKEELFLSLYKKKVPRVTECNVGEVGSKIANGGYGTVYNIIHNGLEHALKIFYIDGDKQNIQFNGRELRTANALSSKGIGPEVHDYGFLMLNDAVVQGYMLMEKYPHDASSDVFEKLDIRDKITVLKETAIQLGKIHSLDLAHNDVKPNNIMFKLDKYGKVSKVAVIDFGLVCKVNKSYGSVQGVIYTPPEQYSVEYKKKISRASTDSYQLALLIWFIFVGEWPFKRVVGNRDVYPVIGTYETYEDYTRVVETETVKKKLEENIHKCYGIEDKSDIVKNYIVHTLLEILIVNTGRSAADRISMHVITEKLNSILVHLL